MPPSTKHNVELLLEWLQTQLALYTAIRIIPPIPPDSQLDTTLCIDLLLCLAHRFFPSSLPDLIVRLERAGNINNLNIAQSLFEQHWQLTPSSSSSSNLLEYMCQIHDMAIIKSNHHEEDNKISQQLCSLLEFVHLKLSSATVLDDDWLGHLEQTMIHASTLQQKTATASNVLQLQYDHLYNWIAQIKAWSSNMDNVSHSHDALQESLQKNDMLSHTILQHLITAPRQALERQKFSERQRKHAQHVAQLQNDWCHAQQVAKTDPANKELMVKARFAYARLDGYTTNHLMSSQLRLLENQHRAALEMIERQHQQLEQQRHMDAFIQQSNELEEQVHHVIQHAMNEWDWEQATAQVNILKDRLTTLTEHTAARIPYPKHINNQPIWQRIHDRKTALVSLQDSLDTALQCHKRKLEHTTYIQQWMMHADMCISWLDSRTCSIHSACHMLYTIEDAMDRSDWEQLDHEWHSYMSSFEAFRIDKLASLLNTHAITDEKMTTIDTALVTLDNAMKQFRQQLDDQLMIIQQHEQYTKLSAKLSEHTRTIWDAVTPIESGHQDIYSSVLVPSYQDDLQVDEQEMPTWLINQIRNFTDLVQYTHTLQVERIRVKDIVDHALDIKVTGIILYHELKQATWTLDMAHPYPAPNQHVVDHFVTQASEFCDMYELLDRQYHTRILTNICSDGVRATRPSPFLPSIHGSYYDAVTESCRILQLIVRSLISLQQQYKDVCQVKHQIKTWMQRATTCTERISFIQLDDEEEYKDVLSEIDELSASFTQLPSTMKLISMQPAFDTMDHLHQQSNHLNQTIKQHVLQKAAQSTKDIWEATHRSIQNDILQNNGDNLDDRMAKLAAHYLAMERAFVDAGDNDICLYTAMQKNLESQVEEFRLKQERQQRMIEYQNKVALWYQQMDILFNKVDQMDTDITQIVYTTQDSLVPPTNASATLDELQQCVIQIPVPDDCIRHWVVQEIVDAPKDTLAMMDDKVYTLQQRIKNIPNSISHARRVMDQCSFMQQLMTEMDDLFNLDDLETLTHSIQALATRIHDPALYIFPHNDNDAETNTRVRETLESKLAALKDKRASVDAVIRHNTRRSECDAIIDNCRLELDTIIQSCAVHQVDPIKVSQDNILEIEHAIRYATDTARSRLTDADDHEMIQKLHSQAKDALEALTYARGLAKETVRDKEHWNAFKAQMSHLSNLHNQHVDEQQHCLKTMDRSLHEITCDIDTACLSVMRAHIAQSSEHSQHKSSMKDQYDDVSCKHQILMDAIATADVKREHKKHVQELNRASDQLIDQIRIVANEMHDARSAWVTDRSTLEQLEERIHSVKTDYAQQVDHVRALCSLAKMPREDVCQQYRMLEETLHDASAFVIKMQGWAHTREMLDHAESSLQDTKHCRELLTRVLAQMDDDDMDARMRYMELFNRVCAMEVEHAALMADQQRQQEIDAQQQSLRKAAETMFTMVDDACSTMIDVAEHKNADIIHDHYFKVLALLMTQRARCDQLERELEDVHICRGLHSSIQHMASVHEALKLIGDHARAAEEIMDWIRVRQDRGTVTQVQLKAYAPMMARFRAFKLPTYEPHMHRIAQSRLAKVESAWMQLLEWMDAIDAKARQQAQYKQYVHQLEEMEAILKSAHFQLDQCQQQLVDDENHHHIDSMLREPEALALERRVQALAERTATLLQEHRLSRSDLIDNEALMERQSAIDTSINKFYDAVEDTQCRVARALTISEYLMLSDDIDLMMSIFKDHIDAAGVVVPSKKEQLSSALEAMEAQQKYYQDHIDDKMDAAAELIVDMPRAVDMHFEALNEQWESVQQQAQNRIAMLKQRLQRRGRLASFPTTMTTTAATPLPPPTATTCRGTNSILPSSSSPLTPRNRRNSNNNNGLPPRSIIKPVSSPARYEPDPTNALDVEIGRVVNETQYAVRVQMVPGQVGKYWFGYRHPRLVYCRILKSGMVMVRVGGGWCELSEFIRERALLEESILCINNNNKGLPQQGFLSTTGRRPSLSHAPPSSSSTSTSFGSSSTSFNNPPVVHLKKSTSSSTISSSNTTNTTLSSTSSSTTLSTTTPGCYLAGDKYMAVDHMGNHHPVRLVKADNIPNTSSGSRTILMK
ncbi:hypothetical protein K492DRAFT_237540 [Lichtheimia hyalospora FSU 10163]|nr:hypothetical protein K492DRAFT_237540 [Lichtheimia hyalospora FSU 10163]